MVTPTVPFPGARPDAAWVQSLLHSLQAASWERPERLGEWVPVEVASQLVKSAVRRYKGRRGGGADDEGVEVGTLVRVGVEADVQGVQPTVVVVGDTHGHLHDVLHILSQAGSPSERLKYVFNGDFVDRGAWGVELLLALLAWRLATPESVTLLRGNHESRYCTMAYGFHAELQAKYGRNCGGALYTSCLSLFAVLPLAATVDRTVLVMHGGLFRQPAARTRGGTRARGGSSGGDRARQAAAGAAARAAMCVGTLDDLRTASSGGPDPDGTGASMLAADVLWSDPMLESGMRENNVRGVGVWFGPDVTQKFLSRNGVRLIVRSHEGPDARAKRPHMPDVAATGFSEDHSGAAGRLCTLFSAPRYPMMETNTDQDTAVLPSTVQQPSNNRGAWLVLSPPQYHEDFRVVSFDAAPRPPACSRFNCT